MADWSAIKAAIATQCGYVSGIKHSSSTNLDSAPVTPAVIITHVSSLDATDRGLGYEYREVEVAGVLVVSTSAGTGTAMSTADGLVESIFTEFRNGTLLGYPGTVQDSYLKTATADEIEVGSIKYEGYRLRFYVAVRESVTRYATRQ